ncbi:MAG TPA: HlyD family type I secretion periplasmic adaptor subunit, partial [Accumulibacter sp.]|nr:HlyD family type I secretion periplasmic adaptor subunit [Accumulibacter sp.]
MAYNPFKRAAKKEISDISAFFDDKPLATTPVEIDINHRRVSRLGWWVLALGFGGFMLWAGLAPLDQGVPANGQVVVTGNRKTVQNLAVGKIEAILVKDGDEVKSGELLVRLDSTAARSQYEMARSQWFVVKAVEARLLAEAANRPTIVFSDELMQSASDPRALSAMEVQKQLFQTRRAGIEAEIGVLKNTLAGLQSYSQGLEESKSAKETQAKLLREELKGQRELADEGYLPRNRLSEQERLLAQLNGAIAEDLGNLGRTRQTIAETKLRIVARQQEYGRDVENGLSDAQKEVTTLDSRLRGLAYDLAHTEIRSPADGVVVGLAIHTVGGVLSPGSPLMDIVPKNEPLQIDVQIPATMIDKVRVGSPVDITFPAFNQKTTPQIPGLFTLVAADVTNDREGKIPPFYRGQVSVTAEGMRKLQTHEIKAGMPAEVFIKTGERTLLNYLFKPLADRM